MSDAKTRRTIALPDGSKDHLARIKTETGASTDVAVIADALKLRARCATKSSDEVMLAVSVFEFIQDATKSGKEVFCEDLKIPGSKYRLVVPSLG